MMRRYAVVVERAGSNHSAYAPDLPGCIASGDSVEETWRTCGKPLLCTSGDCVKMVCPSLAMIEQTGVLRTFGDP
jgi:hypothetical protein